MRRSAPQPRSRKTPRGGRTMAIMILIMSLSRVQLARSRCLCGLISDHREPADHERAGGKHREREEDSRCGESHGDGIGLLMCSLLCGFGGEKSVWQNSGSLSSGGRGFIYVLLPDREGTQIPTRLCAMMSSAAFYLPSRYCS
jgi:hypothetical protein